MRIFAVVFVLVAAVIAGHRFIIKPLLRQWATFKPLYDTLDKVEATWFFRATMSLKGLRTVIIAWIGIIVPMVIAVLQYLEQVDITPLLPEKYRPLWPLALSALSAIFLQLRHWSETRVGEPIQTDAGIVDMAVPTVKGMPNVTLELASTPQNKQLDLDVTQQETKVQVLDVKPDLGDVVTQQTQMDDTP